MPQSSQRKFLDFVGLTKLIELLLVKLDSSGSLWETVNSVMSPAISGNKVKLPETYADGDITPTVDGTHSLGTSVKKFKAIYADEVHISNNTLYIDDVPVIGSSGNNINISADEDQSILVKTTGDGITQLASDAGVTLSAKGTNSIVTISGKGTNSAVNLSADSGVNITAPNISITGTATIQDLNVTGTTTTVNSTNLAIKDNLIEINKGETGDGVTAGTAGFRIDRGEETDYIVQFDESDDKLKAGFQGSLKTIATTDDVNALSDSVDTALAGKSDTGHNHNDIYYTESEVDTLLSGKAAASHTHSQYLTAHAPVDSVLSSTSTNAVQNKVINAALAGKSDTGHTHSQYLTAHATVDSALSSTSTNAVQNKVINAALAEKAAASHTHSQYLTGHQDISGKANTSGTYSGLSVGYATSATRLYSDDSKYAYGSNSPYYMHFTYNDYGDYRWYLRVYPETPSNVRVDYANSAGSATNASYLSYASGNEINFKGGRKADIYINYKNADDGTSSAVATKYNFCNYGGSTSSVTITAATFSGNLSGTANAAYYSDYAEFFPRGQETEIGDIIALDESAENEQYIKATENSICVVGVHSEEYGMIVGGENPENETASRENYLKYNLSKYIPVSLAGRVPVKFIGKAKKGMQVVPSEIPGVGREFDNLKDYQRNIIGYLVESDDKEDEVRLLKMKIK